MPDADAIYETVPDAEHNRVILTMNRRSDALLAELSARYGSDTFAVRIDSSKPLGMPMAFGAAEAQYAPVALHPGARASVTSALPGPSHL